MKVYIAEIDKYFSENAYESLKTKVSERRQDKAETYKNIEDKVRCICAELLLKRINPDEFKNGFLYDDAGKPYLKNGPCFSISHSGKYVAAVISEKGFAGVDVQEIKPVDERILKKVCFANELKLIENSDDKTEMFFELWTIKESIIKAVGHGFKTVSLAEQGKIKNSIEIGNTKYNIKTFSLDGYKLSVVSEDIINEYEIIKI